jgi:hypothetical protein
VLDCTILMSNGPIVNQLLLKKSIAQLKFEWWHFISQYCSVWRFMRWYFHYWTLCLEGNPLLSWA